MKKKNRTYIIAEIGPNHNGSFSKARKMINALKEFDIDAIKFQIANPQKVYSDDSFMATYQKKNDRSKSIIEMSKKNQLSKKEHIKLSRQCKKNKIDYLCSAFDKESLEFLVNKIKVPIIKIPSGEITALDILKFISKQRKKIFLSTGMSNIQDIENALKIINKNFKKKVTLLHCVSSYPADKNKLNLNLIKKLKEIFNLEIGYSDHSLGAEACLAAVAMGAKVIEKHVTLSRNSRGPDHKSSMEIRDFKLMVEQIRNLEIMMGLSKKEVFKDEKEIQKVARKSIVSKRFIPLGKKISFKDICFKRPGTGISPIDIKKIIGKISKKNILPNKVLNKKFF